MRATADPRGHTHLLQRFLHIIHNELRPLPDLTRHECARRARSKGRLDEIMPIALVRQRHEQVARLQAACVDRH